VEAAGSLSGLNEARNALLAATKDADARVRTRAITSLAATKDPTFADAYQQLLNDQSYAVIRAAAVALGQAKSPSAYDSLIKLIDTPSWRDTIRASALSGLAALGDKRALDLGLKYYGAGNRTAVRSAAATLSDKTFSATRDSANRKYLSAHRSYLHEIEYVIALWKQTVLGA